MTPADFDALADLSERAFDAIANDADTIDDARTMARTCARQLRWLRGLPEMPQRPMARVIRFPSGRTIEVTRD